MSATSEPIVKKPKVESNGDSLAQNGSTDKKTDAKEPKKEDPKAEIADDDDDNEPVMKKGGRKQEQASRNCPYLGTIDRLVIFILEMQRLFQFFR